MQALDEMSDAIAHATIAFAQTRSAIEGTDKGKGKVDDVKDLPGAKKTQNDEKTQANGKKKEEESKEGMS